MEDYFRERPGRAGSVRAQKESEEGRGSDGGAGAELLKRKGKFQ